jgi:hypothetical protein
MTHVPSSLLTVLGYLACGSLRIEQSFVEEGRVDRVRVRWASGEIHVRGGTTDDVRVHAEVWGPEAPLAFTHERDAEILLVELRCQTPVPCGGSLDLDLPTGVAVETDLGEGSVDLAGPIGRLSVIVGDGSIDARVLTAEEAVLQVVQGPVDAAWSRTPRRVMLSSVEGDVRVRVPPGSYQVQSGGREAEVHGIVVDPSAASLIRVTALGGEAVVEGVGSVADAGPLAPGGLVAR